MAPQTRHTRSLSEDWLSVLVGLAIVALVWIGTSLGWSGSVLWPLFKWFA